METLYLLRNHVLGAIDSPADLDSFAKAMPVIAAPMNNLSWRIEHQMVVNARWKDVMHMWNVPRTSFLEDLFPFGVIYALRDYTVSTGHRLAAYSCFDATWILFLGYNAEPAQAPSPDDVVLVDKQKKLFIARLPPGKHYTYPPETDDDSIEMSCDLRGTFRGYKLHI